MIEWQRASEIAKVNTGCGTKLIWSEKHQCFVRAWDNFEEKGFYQPWSKNQDAVYDRTEVFDRRNVGDEEIEKGMIWTGQELVYVAKMNLLNPFANTNPHYRNVNFVVEQVNDHKLAFVPMPVRGEERKCRRIRKKKSRSRSPIEISSDEEEERVPHHRSSHRKSKHRVETIVRSHTDRNQLDREEQSEKSTFDHSKFPPVKKKSKNKMIINAVYNLQTPKIATESFS